MKEITEWKQEKSKCTKETNELKIDTSVSIKDIIEL